MTNEEFVRLVSDAEKSLYRVAKSILMNDEDCADAIQSAILNAFDKLDTLRQKKHFTTWLTRILINECYQIMRSRREQIPYEEYMESQEIQQENGEVYEAVMELEEKYRMPVVLYYIEGYSVKEVANILEISVSNVKVRLSRARNMLKDILKGA